MKHNFKFLGLLLILPFLAENLAAQSVTWKPENPTPGGNLNFVYSAKGGDLEFSDSPKATLSVFDGRRWTGKDIPLTRKGEGWSAVYPVPQNTLFLALKFYQGDPSNPEAKDINGGKGYYRKISSDSGMDRSGSNMAEALFRTGMTADWNTNSFVSPNRDSKVVDSLLSREEDNSKGIPRSMFFNYLELKGLTMSSTDYAKWVDARIKSEAGKGELTEDFLAGMRRYYIRTKNKYGSDRIEELINQKFPSSGTARLLAYRKAADGKFGGEFQIAVENYLKKYPYSEWKKKPDSKGYLYYEIFRGLGSQYFDSGQTEKFLSLFNEIDFKTANEIYRWNITRGQMAGKVDRKMLYGLSKKIIPYLLKHRQDGSYLSDFGGDRKKAQENADNQLDDRLFTHIYLANNQEDFNGANDHFRFLSSKGAYKDADLNEMHLNVLTKIGHLDSIKPMLERAVAENAVTPFMFDKLKSVYKSEHSGKEDGYPAYLASLTPDEKIKEMRELVMEDMVNHPLIPFTLEDADGNLVSSADWKNKVVVIDFWATWCRPCIMAFPGMQLLVDKYAADTQVKIYMIGTMQSGDYKSKSVNYVRGEGYRFNLLHDAIGSTGEQDQVFKSLVPLFKSSAIPRKIIVKNGVVRYSSEGYSGSPSQLRDELSMAIEILKKED